MVLESFIRKKLKLENRVERFPHVRHDLSLEFVESHNEFEGGQIERLIPESELLSIGIN